MSFEPVRMASIGVGYWGRMLAQGALASGRAQIVGCYSPTVARCEAFAREFNAQPYASLAEALEDPLVEAVLVATPNAEHAADITRAAQAGKHILVEKPITLSIEEAQVCIRACKNASVILTVGHQYRRENPIRRMQAMITAGEIGTVISVEANISTGTVLQQTPGSWRLEERQVPGGPLVQIGIHHIDTLMYLLGRIESVSSLVRRRQVQAIDDASVICLGFESGVLGTLVSNYCTTYSSVIKVMGTRGTLIYDRHQGLEIQQDTPERANRCLIVVKPNDPVREQVAEFAACVRSGQAPEVRGEDGLLAMAVVLAALRSQQEKRQVTLQEILGNFTIN